jgi:hypothetical protein
VHGDVQDTLNSTKRRGEAIESVSGLEEAIHECIRILNKTRRREGAQGSGRRVRVWERTTNERVKENNYTLDEDEYGSYPARVVAASDHASGYCMRRKGMKSDWTTC